MNVSNKRYIAIGGAIILLYFGYRYYNNAQAQAAVDAAKQKEIDDKKAAAPATTAVAPAPVQTSAACDGSPQFTKGTLMSADGTEQPVY